MLETLRCPGCSTRFVIGPGRVRPGIRRARCFRCSTVFPIEEAVARLLAAAPSGLPEPAVPAAESDPALVIDLDAVPDLDLATIPGPAPAPREPAVPGAGFASARDAIEKLLGGTPVQPAPARLPDREALEVEATLEALDTTLGDPPVPDPAPAAAPAPGLDPPAPKPDTASTVKLTPEEIRSALAAAAVSAPPAPEPPAPAEPEPAPAQELLKVQVEQETTHNVSHDQMTAWIEQGRVLDYHLVAREYSENWIEAGKVPALRPVFDRMRKAHQAEEAARPAPEPPPVKRSLFSGLFGRN